LQTVRCWITPGACETAISIPLFRALHYLEWLIWAGERASVGAIMRHLVERHH
jgi:hypothetical protein